MFKILLLSSVQAYMDIAGKGTYNLDDYPNCLSVPLYASYSSIVFEGMDDWLFKDLGMNT